jgi:hypothetical protein
MPRVRIRRGTSTPTASQLVDGELAVDTLTGNLYVGSGINAASPPQASTVVLLNPLRTLAGSGFATSASRSDHKHVRTDSYVGSIDEPRTAQSPYVIDLACPTPTLRTITSVKFDLAGGVFDFALKVNGSTIVTDSGVDSAITYSTTGTSQGQLHPTLRMLMQEDKLTLEITSTDADRLAFAIRFTETGVAP